MEALESEGPQMMSGAVSLHPLQSCNVGLARGDFQRPGLFRRLVQEVEAAE